MDGLAQDCTLEKIPYQRGAIVYPYSTFYFKIMGSDEKFLQGEVFIDVGHHGPSLL